jgi:ABC-type antimicrobial peptide transport system permease subunit
LAGTAAAFGVGAAADALAARVLPPFPYQPDTFFHFSPALLLGALGFAVLFCVLGAYLPARRAANLPPAKALTS